MALLLASCATAAATPVPGSRAGSAVPAPQGSGAYVGAAATEALRAFGTWRGHPADFAVDYLPDDDWAALEQPTWWVQRWGASRMPLVLGVPMLVRDSATTVERGAAGAYDDHFRRLGAFLVAHGYAQASLRVGWEMNGDWYRWSAARDPAAWKEFFRHVVRALRSVPGQAFRIDWTISLGAAAVQADLCYPGDAYVDDVGIDAYDWKWGASEATPEARWAFVRGQPYGLDWTAAFARAHGKGLTVPEWGLAQRSSMQRGGGGDDPYYVRSLRAWAAAHDVRYEAYFDWGEHRLRSGRYPRAAQEYRDG